MCLFNSCHEFVHGNCRYKRTVKQRICFFGINPGMRRLYPRVKASSRNPNSYGEPPAALSARYSYSLATFVCGVPMQLSMPSPCSQLNFRRRIDGVSDTVAGRRRTRSLIMGNSSESTKDSDSMAGLSLTLAWLVEQIGECWAAVVLLAAGGHAPAASY
jgi:hypothetical protein